MTDRERPLTEAEKRAVIEAIRAGDAPREMLVDVIGLVERECTTCGAGVWDSPENDDPVTCEDHT